MRSELLREQRTRTSAALVVLAVICFHLLLVLAMGLLLLFMGTSIPGFVAGGIGLVVAWRALTVQAPATDRRRLVDLQDYPGLQEALTDAAERVGVRLPDGVRITAAARIYANEEGALPGGLIRTRRLLVVGAAAFPFLTKSEVSVLLARSLARWSGGETWYGVQARRVELATALVVEHLGAGWTRWVNPLYWLFRGFQLAFARVLAAYCRERELWADQVAATAYSAADVESAVKKQALYDAFWLEELAGEFMGDRTHSFQQVWARMEEASRAYGRWGELWQRLLTASRRAEDGAPTLAERLEALAAPTQMPPPARPALSPATATFRTQ